jgi:hypothetical protein
MNPTFQDFWNWLLKNSGSGSLLKNLGGQGEFEIIVSGNTGACIPQATMNSHPFTKDQARQVWKRFHGLPLNRRLMAGHYVDGKRPHNLNPCPNRFCCPWIAAAIRDFLSGKLPSATSNADTPPGVIKDKKVAVDSYCVCKVWKFIQSTRIYRSQISLPTMGGKAANLFFQYDHRSKQIHVWRANGSPNFWINEAHFHTICRRYHFCLRKGLVPVPPKMGGTAQFNNPKWPNPPLGRNKTPYVPPIIRHIFRTSPRLMAIQPCC